MISVFDAPYVGSVKTKMQYNISLIHFQSSMSIVSRSTDIVGSYACFAFNDIYRYKPKPPPPSLAMGIEFSN